MELINFQACVVVVAGFLLPSVGPFYAGSQSDSCLHAISGMPFNHIVMYQSLLRLQLLTHYKCECDRLFAARSM